MSSITGPFRLLAGLLFLTACGVAVEQAPQTSGTGSAEMNAAAPDADATPPSDSDGLIIDNIIASLGKTETEPGVAEPATEQSATEQAGGEQAGANSQQPNRRGANSQQPNRRGAHPRHLAVMLIRHPSQRQRKTACPAPKPFWHCWHP
jgi:HAMP domain-containing protein